MFKENTEYKTILILDCKLSLCQIRARLESHWPLLHAAACVEMIFVHFLLDALQQFKLIMWHLESADTRLK